MRFGEGRMTAPGCLAALLAALACAFGTVIATGLGWDTLAAFFGVAGVFTISIALTYVIPAAVDDRLNELENER